MREVSDAVDYVWSTASVMLMLVFLPIVAAVSFGVVFIMPCTDKSGLSGNEHTPWYGYPFMFCVMIGAAWWWCNIVKHIMDDRKRNGK